MPITTSIGEGVGCAAALALKNQIPVRQVNSDELHHLMDTHKALY
jgi:hypothetical protein